MEPWNKDLPEWAKVGTEVLVTSPWGDSAATGKISRVTRTSAFIGSRRFVVPSKYSDKKSLEEWGSGDSWRSGPSIRPLDSDEARGVLEAARNRKRFYALRNDLEKAVRSLNAATYRSHVETETVDKAIADIEAAIATYRNDDHA